MGRVTHPMHHAKCGRRAAMTFGIYQFVRIRVMSTAMESGIRKDIQRRPQALDWLGLARMVGLRGSRAQLEAFVQLLWPTFKDCDSERRPL